MFRDIVSTMGEGMYLPHNFTNMIVYLVYLSKREEIRGRVVAERTEIGEKVQRIDCLLRLKDLSLNN